MSWTLYCSFEGFAFFSYYLFLRGIFLCSDCNENQVQGSDVCGRWPRVPFTRAAFAVQRLPPRRSFQLTPMGAFTRSRDGTFVAASAASCHPACKTVTAEKSSNGLGGHVFLRPVHTRWHLPRAASHQMVRCLSTNISRKSTPPPRLHHWKSWYALYSPSCELSMCSENLSLNTYYVKTIY